MSGYSFDTNIVVDALAGLEAAAAEIRRATDETGRAWISRVVWIEVMSKGTPDRLEDARVFLAGFAMDEVDAGVAERAASLRRERSGLRLPDAIILASAHLRGRVLITRNTKDFPAETPGIRVPYTL